MSRQQGKTVHNKCLHPEKWVEIDGRLTSLADQLSDACKSIHDSLVAIDSGQKEINKRLFVDNGNLSIQTRLNNLDSRVRLLTAILYAVGAVSLTAITKAFLDLIIGGR